jgi:hypothetical protein
MTDLSAEIREHLGEYGNDYDMRPVGYDYKLHAALLAVLDLHPNINGLCLTCATDARPPLNERPTHPCRTVLAIATGLGIEVDDA